MNKIKLLFALILCGLSMTAFAQTADELKATKAEKEAQVSALQGEIGGIQAQLDAMPGWRTGAFGTIGLNFSNFADWYSKGTPNSSSGSIGFTANGFANLIEDKFFWRNSGNINLGWVKFDDKDDPDDDDSFRKATDVFSLSSLYGRKLSDKFAISGLGEYRTTILENFNDPGYLDLGVGATWTPLANMVVVFHPLNYNIIFTDTEDIYESSMGCKIVADYTQSLPGGISWKSNLSTFLSYKDLDNLTNWTWINSLAMKIFKGIGVGFEFGLRGNKQEALDYEINTLGKTDATFDSVDNKVQTYWLLGFTYAL